MKLFKPKGKGFFNKDSLAIDNIKNIDETDGILVTYKNGNQVIYEKYDEMIDNKGTTKTAFSDALKSFDKLNKLIDTNVIQIGDITYYNGNFVIVDNNFLNKFKLDIFRDGNCIAYYPMNGNAIDLSGRYNGTWNGTESYVNDKFGKSAKFDGNSGIIVDFNFKLTCPFSYTGWFKPSKTGNDYQVIFGWDYAGMPSSNEFDYWLISIDKGNSWYLNVGAHSKEHSTSKITVPDNKWIFFYAEFTSDGIRLILMDEDKNLIGDVNKSVSLSNSLSTKVAFGSWIFDINESGLSRFFTGLINRIRVFTRILTDAEISIVYNEQLPLIKKFSL